MSAPSSASVLFSPSDRSAVSISESTSTLRASSPVDLSSPVRVVSPSTTSSPKAISPRATPPRSRRDSSSTVREQSLSSSVSHPLAALVPLSTAPIYSSSLSLPGHFGDSGGSSFRSRSRSPLGRLDDTITQWGNHDEPRRASQRNKSPHGWWTTNEHKGKNLELQEPIAGWQQVKAVRIYHLPRSKNAHIH